MNTKTAPFAPGQRIYSRSGQVAQFVMYLGGPSYGNTQLVVQTIYGDIGASSGEWLGGVDTWHEAFVEPPRALYDADIEVLQQRKDELINENARLVAQQAELKREAEKRIDRLQQHEALSLLEAFLEKQITHLVVDRHSEITIEPATVEMEDKKPGGLRLISLYGDTKGDLSWRVSSYQSQHGSELNIFPARGLEEAQQLARIHVNRQIREKHLKPSEWKLNPWTLNGLMKNAERFGVDVPDEMRAALREHMIKNARAGVTEAENKAAAARAHLAGLGAVDVDENA